MGKATMSVTDYCPKCGEPLPLILSEGFIDTYKCCNGHVIDVDKRTGQLVAEEVGITKRTLEQDLNSLDNSIRIARRSFLDHFGSDDPDEDPSLNPERYMLNMIILSLSNARNVLRHLTDAAGDEEGRSE